MPMIRTAIDREQEIEKGLVTSDIDQFMVFQPNRSLDVGWPTLLDSTEVLPSIDGGFDNPDVLVGIEMLSFHVGDNQDIEDIDKSARAILKMDRAIRLQV
jgi:hypothetical protein